MIKLIKVSFVIRKLITPLNGSLPNKNWWKGEFVINKMWLTIIEFKDNCFQFLHGLCILEETGNIRDDDVSKERNKFGNNSFWE